MLAAYLVASAVEHVRVANTLQTHFFPPLCFLLLDFFSPPFSSDLQHFVSKRAVYVRASVFIPS